MCVKSIISDPKARYIVYLKSDYAQILCNFFMISIISLFLPSCTNPHNQQVLQLQSARTPSATYVLPTTSHIISNSSYNQGNIYYTDGSYYIGGIVNGQASGLGRLVSRDGTICGTWTFNTYVGPHPSCSNVQNNMDAIRFQLPNAEAPSGLSDTLRRRREDEQKRRDEERRRREEEQLRQRQFRSF
jgi:hypothetical protein